MNWENAGHIDVARYHHVELSLLVRKFDSTFHPVHRSVVIHVYHVEMFSDFEVLLDAE